MSKNRNKRNAIANATQTNVVTIDATQHDATRDASTFTNNVATTQTTQRVETKHATNVIRHNKNERMTNEQINDEIDKLLYELYTLQHDENAKHKNEQKRVRRALRSFNYHISHTNVVEHEQRVKRVVEQFANVAK